DDGMFGLAAVGVDEFGIANALNIDLPRTEINHTAIACHSFPSLVDEHRARADFIPHHVAAPAPGGDFMGYVCICGCLSCLYLLGGNASRVAQFNSRNTTRAGAPSPSLILIGRQINS